MLSAIVAVALSQFPVDLPRELGHLRLMSSKTTYDGVEIELEYQNVTELTFASVSVECTVFDHREVAVNDEYKVLNNDGAGFAPGARVFAKMLVTDHVARARRAECAVVRANKAPIQLASAPVEETPRAPIIRVERHAPIIPDEVVPAPEATKPPEPVKPSVVAPPPPAAKTPPPAVVTPTPAPVAKTPAPVAAPPAPAEVCCKKCSGATKACGDTCISINEKCRQWAGCACTVE